MQGEKSEFTTLIENTNCYSHSSEADLEVARNELGSLAEELSDQELQETVAEIHYLAESWLDDFERNIFAGKTLREFLESKSVL
jgi:hypothetical protein